MTQPLTVHVHRLRDDAVVPSSMTALAAGFDLVAAIDAAITLAPGARAIVGTGLALAIPAGFEGQVRPRSGLAAKHGVTVLNAPGTIDADYRGEVGVILVNHGQQPHVIEPGARIAQLVIAAVPSVALELVAALPATARGAGGFGSTGA
jgi:dUTP pyrophosphatase